MSERIADAVQGAFFCRLRVIASREEPNTLSILHWWKYYILQVVNFPLSLLQRYLLVYYEDHHHDERV